MELRLLTKGVEILQSKIKYWEKIKGIDKYCIFCGRQVGSWEGEYSVTKRKQAVCFHRDCYKKEQERNRRIKNEVPKMRK